MNAPGYRVYAVGEDHVRGQELAAASRDHLVIGRHTSCDLVLDVDPAISLRHVLVRASVLDDGLPVLSVLDLESGTGFELSDGSRQRAVVMSGAVAFRIGATWFIGLPTGEALPPALEAPLVMDADVGSHRVNPRAAPMIGHARAISRIMSVPHSVHLAHRPATTDDSLRATGEERFELTIEDPMRQARVRFSERDAEHGIFVGRSDKCADAGLRRILDANPGVSRVHVLVIRERDGLRLYDIASTNGVFDEDARRIRSCTIADGPEQQSWVVLGGAGRVVLRWLVLRV